MNWLMNWIALMAMIFNVENRHIHNSPLWLWWITTSDWLSTSRRCDKFSVLLAHVREVNTTKVALKAIECTLNSVVVCLTVLSSEFCSQCLSYKAFRTLLLDRVHPLLLARNFDYSFLQYHKHYNTSKYNSF